MYAVVLSGGKQYRISEGDTIRVETLSVEAGDTVVLDKVLMVSQEDDVTVGSPYIEGAGVKAKVEHNGRSKKILVFKHKKTYRRRQGHRQNYTQLGIEQISLNGEFDEAVEDVAPIIEESLGETSETDIELSKDAQDMSDALEMSVVDDVVAETSETSIDLSEDTEETGEVVGQVETEGQASVVEEDSQPEEDEARSDPINFTEPKSKED